MPLAGDPWGMNGGIPTRGGLIPESKWLITYIYIYVWGIFPYDITGPRSHFPPGAIYVKHTARKHGRDET